jgi:two-component system response regulator HydG
MHLKHSSILITDDDPDVLTAVRLLLKPLVKEVVTEKNPENLPALLSQQAFDLVLLDMNFRSAINTGNEGFYWLDKIKSLRPAISVIMITAYGDIDLAVRSLKQGASDFVIKPWHNEMLISAITDALKPKGKSSQRIPEKNKDQEMIGDSVIFSDLLHKLEKVAPTDANILILGENGTGKDLIAQAIHKRSLRSAGPFIKVDVGALTDSLFESELFGHKRGAFTDAREDRTGRFEAAQGGTLFLDEIGNITLQQQAKLLSVLQNRQVIRLGSNESIPIDIRLICATNLPLNELANEHRFRKDLIYRINTVELTVPPLRMRDEDIILLAKHFGKVYASKYMKTIPEFDRKALDKLMQHPFPGNVRELQYTIERAVIMAEDKVLHPDDLIFSPIESQAGVPLNADFNLNNIEKNAILLVIEKHGGNITRAAKELGLTRTALYRRLNKYDL